VGLFAPPPQGLRVSVDDTWAAQKLGGSLWQGIRYSAPAEQGLVALCIGTDRSTGDALGPLTGSFLEALDCPQLRIMGTLAQPVHATNLKEAVSDLRAESKENHKALHYRCGCLFGSVGQRGQNRPGAGRLEPRSRGQQRLAVGGRLPYCGDCQCKRVHGAPGASEHRLALSLPYGRCDCRRHRHRVFSIIRFQLRCRQKPLKGLSRLLS
jgi:putative sporulation protein YyaC